MGERMVAEYEQPRASGVVAVSWGCNRIVLSQLGMISGTDFIYLGRMDQQIRTRYCEMDLYDYRETWVGTLI